MCIRLILYVYYTYIIYIRIYEDNLYNRYNIILKVILVYKVMIMRLREMKSHLQISSF